MICVHVSVTSLHSLFGMKLAVSLQLQLVNQIELDMRTDMAQLMCDALWLNRFISEFTELSFVFVECTTIAGLSKRMWIYIKTRE